METPVVKSRREMKTAYIVASVAISCLMIGASLGIIIQGTTPSIPTVLQPGSMATGAAFVIFDDGSETYARNGTTGAVLYGSTDFSHTMQACLDAVLGSGGTIQIKAGNYSASRTIYYNGTQQGNLIIQGQTGGMQYYHSLGTRIYKDGSYTLFDFQGIAPAFANAITFDRLGLFSLSGTGVAISIIHGAQIIISNSVIQGFDGAVYTNNVYDLLIQGNWIVNCGNDVTSTPAMQLTGSGGGSGWSTATKVYATVFEDCEYIYIDLNFQLTTPIVRDCYFEDSVASSEGFIHSNGQAIIDGNHMFGTGGYGIEAIGWDEVIQNNQIGSSGDIAIICSGPRAIVSENMVHDGYSYGIMISSYGALVKNNVFYRNNYSGILVYGNHNTISGNVLQENEQGEIWPNAGIHLAGANNTLSENTFLDLQASRTQTTGIQESNITAGSTVHVGENNTIISNLFYNETTPISLPAWSLTLVRGNIGYKTEAKGIAYISSSTTVTFNHGLAKQPTIVLASFNSTAYSSWEWSASATQITITVTTSGTYTVTWYAEV